MLYCILLHCILLNCILLNWILLLCIFASLHLAVLHLAALYVAELHVAALTTVSTHCHRFHFLWKKAFSRYSVLSDWVPCPRNTLMFLGSCSACVEVSEAWGSTIVFQRLLCINNVNSGRAFPVGWHSCALQLAELHLAVLHLAALHVAAQHLAALHRVALHLAALAQVHWSPMH